VVFITDFSKCRPGDRIGGGVGQWSTVDYATERFNGKLLHAHRAAPPGEVTLDLNASGWYAVYVWLIGLR
jgi:hypothetical protein